MQTHASFLPQIRADAAALKPGEFIVLIVSNCPFTGLDSERQRSGSRQGDYIYRLGGSGSGPGFSGKPGLLMGVLGRMPPCLGGVGALAEGFEDRWGY